MPTGSTGSHPLERRILLTGDGRGRANGCAMGGEAAAGEEAGGRGLAASQDRLTLEIIALASSIVFLRTSFIFSFGAAETGRGRRHR